MQTLRKLAAAMLFIAGSLLITHASDSVTKTAADAADLQTVSPADLPSEGGTYWVTMLSPNGGLTALPWPFLPPNLTNPTIYSVTNQVYLVDTTDGKLTTDDTTLSSADAATTSKSQANSMASLIEDIEFPPAPGTNEDGTYGEYSPLGLPNINDSTNFWLQLSNTIPYSTYGGQDSYIDVAYFYLHNMTNTLNYCVYSTTNLTTYPIWTPLPLTAGPLRGHNGTALYEDYYEDSFEFPDGGTNEFFWANGSQYIIAIYPYTSTRSTSYPSSPSDTSQNLTYTLYFAYGGTPPFVTFYALGSAVYGVDFTIPGTTYNSTNHLITLPIPPGTGGSMTLTWAPIYTSSPTFPKTSTIQLTPFGEVPLENSYYANINLSPQVIPSVVVTNFPGQDAYWDGIGFNPVQNAIIATANVLSNGDPFNFFSVSTNDSDDLVVNTNYSTIAGLPGEVELTIAQTTTNGWNAGDMYFADASYYSSVDKLSADGTWSQFWCPLTNAAVVDGICFDETGVFSNNIVCVTADDKVYTITSNGIPNLIATITNAQTLNGAIVIPNNVTNWGPWAGKILTGDPDLQNLFTIDTNGTVTTYQTTNYVNGISVEEFALVPPSQNMYFLDAAYGNLDEIASTNLTPYVGWLAISSGSTSSSYPEGNNYYPLADIFLVKWDATNSVFDVRGIPGLYSSSYEDLTFAPINLSP